jgi:ribokinase
MPTPTQISYEIKWEHVDWLVVNEGEAQQLLDAFPAPSLVLSPETQLLGDSPSSALRSSRLISRLASQSSFKNINIVCTLGPLGVVAHLPSATKGGDSTQIIYEPGVPTREVRDTTGAGDCWTGYLVAGLMELEVKSASPSTDLDREDVRRLLRRCNQVCRLISPFHSLFVPGRHIH